MLSFQLFAGTVAFHVEANLSKFENSGGLTRARAVLAYSQFDENRRRREA